MCLQTCFTIKQKTHKKPLKTPIPVGNVKLQDMHSFNKFDEYLGATLLNEL